MLKEVARIIKDEVDYHLQNKLTEKIQSQGKNMKIYQLMEVLFRFKQQSNDHPQTKK
jgi:hypothetical protein